jgi:DNA gyrase subunit B
VTYGHYIGESSRASVRGSDEGETRNFYDFLAENPKSAKAIIEKSLLAARARAAARNARDTIIRK